MNLARIVVLLLYNTNWNFMPAFYKCVTGYGVLKDRHRVAVAGLRLSYEDANNSMEIPKYSPSQNPQKIL